jgi:acetyl esterase/lipase
MKKVCFWGLLALWMVGGTAVAQTELKLYSGTPPGNLNARNRESFFNDANGRDKLRNVTIPSVFYFPPTGVTPSRTAVIICPGGGYRTLSIFDGGYDVAKAFAAAGIHAFVLKYRTATDSAFTRYETLPFLDLQQAHRLIGQNAANWQIDTTKIGVLGLSAGGHLAAMAFTPRYQLPLAFNILVYPVVSFTDSLVSDRLQSRKAIFGNRRVTDVEKRAYSPELSVSAGHPPSFLIHAMNDSTSLVTNSLVYYRALIARRIPAKLLLYQKGGHGFALYNKEEDDYWLPSVLKWLRLNKLIP